MEDKANIKVNGQPDAVNIYFVSSYYEVFMRGVMWTLGAITAISSLAWLYKLVSNVRDLF